METGYGTVVFGMVVKAIKLDNIFFVKNIFSASQGIEYLGDDDANVTCSSRQTRDSHGLCSF